MGVCRKHCVEKAQKKLKHFICFGKVREQINKKTKTETDRHPIAIEDGYKSKLFSFTYILRTWTLCNCKSYQQDWLILLLHIYRKMFTCYDFLKEKGQEH